MNILHIDSSASGQRSHSRQLTQAFVQELKAAQPDATLVYHDLARQPVPPVDEAWVEGAFSDPATHSPQAVAAIAVSDKLVDELLACDVFVIGAPMYNLSIPAPLKAYIDQIVRIGRTLDPATHQGMVKGKKMFVLTARGGSGYGPGEERHPMNFQDTYLKAIFGFIGITDMTFIHDEKTRAEPNSLQESLDCVRQTARGVAKSA